MPGSYEITFSDGDRSVPVPDPMPRLVADFVSRVRRSTVERERAERAREFQRETERAFSFGGRQIARSERAEAGFTEEELDEIEELAASRAEGPRRETLLAAAELLRDRHRARKRGEDVPPLDA